MARTVALLLASASALVPPAATPARPATRLAYTASEALPFMERPASLDELEMAGDVGFDPFGFSSVFNVKWLREAEIKHGRICMLAWTGFVATDLGLKLPGVTLKSVEAHDANLGECVAARRADPCPGPNVPTGLPRAPKVIPPVHICSDAGGVAPWGRYSCSSG